MRWITYLTNLFPLWTAGCGILALVRPRWFDWFSGALITWGLAAIMLGMGLTLRVEDFRRVFQRPRAVAVGLGAQFLIMPLLGWSIAHLLQLDTALAVGLILVSCCPGGTASNVVSFLARADVALSVTMTACSTLAAIAMTPWLTKLLAGTLVKVNAWGLFLNTLQVVLLPVLLGLALHHYLPRVTRVLLPVAPLISVVFIVLIVASVMAQRATDIRESAGRLLGAVALLHVGGFALGYAVAHVLRLPGLACRTVSIEVGMQNSGLGTYLAQQNFPTLPAAATPCAISAVFHSIIGSALAGWWRWRSMPATDGSSPDEEPGTSVKTPEAAG